MNIKICGLKRIEDIEAVNLAMPDYIGYVLAKSKRQVTVEHVKSLNQKLNPLIQKTGVFVNSSKEDIARLLLEGIIDIAQLHGNETEEEICWLQQNTGKTIVKAVSMSSDVDMNRWNASSADYLLLDNGSGGTGCRFDWNLIALCTKPFFLAGGLNLDNLKEALQTNAYALDVSGGAETDGTKDAKKIQNIVSIVRNYRN